MLDQITSSNRSRPQLFYDTQIFQLNRVVLQQQPFLEQLYCIGINNFIEHLLT